MKAHSSVQRPDPVFKGGDGGHAESVRLNAHLNRNRELTVVLVNSAVTDALRVAVLTSIPVHARAFDALLDSLVSFRSRAALQLEILALRHQLGVLQRSAKRPKPMTADRLLWVRLSAVWKDWRTEIFLVSTATVLGRHRWGFGLFSTWRTRRGQRGYLPRGREFELHSLPESQLAALSLKLITSSVSIT